jgi:hypothetical protein
MNTHPLIKNFPPLPSLDFILAIADGRNPNRPPPLPPISSTGSQGGPYPVYTPNPSGPPLGPVPSLPPRCYCCINGRVVQMTEANCERRGGQCFASEQEALRNCPPKQTCWCCINAPDTKTNARAYAATGQVVQTTEADCRERGGQCYGSRNEALKNCRGVGPTPTPTVTSYRPYPTPRPAPTATPYSPGGRVGRPTPAPTPYQPGGRVGGLNNPPKPTPTPKKRVRQIKRATPTPTPSQIIR